MKPYPSILQSIHLVVLYIFVQTIIDFPLAIFDYYYDTEFLYNPYKKIVLGVGSVVFILYYGFRRTRNPLNMVFPFKKFNPAILVFLVIFFLGAQQILNLVNGWVEKAIPPPSWFWEMFGKIFDNDYGFWGAFMKVVIIAPVIEELIFRGVIMHGLMRNYSEKSAVFFSGLLFALFHLNPWQFPATFVLGLILGWLMIRSHNILLCIAGHAINNLLVLLTITFRTQVKDLPWPSPGDSGLLIVSFLLVLVAVICIYFITQRKYETLKVLLKSNNEQSPLMMED
jgi:uncharacterized protein